MAVFKISFIFIFVTIIIKIKNECNKEVPIQIINDDCQNIYCTEEEFESGVCTISNLIVKEQWLNDIIIIEGNFLGINPILTPNKEIILLNFYDADGEDRYPYFYYLNSNGEILQEKIYDSFLFYNYINGIGLNIENKYYPLICDIFSCFLFDLENNIISEADFIELMQIDDSFFPSTFIFTIINIDENKILFTYFNEKIYLSIIDITTNDISSVEKIHKSNGEIEGVLKLDNFKCFITKKKFIECLYISDYKILVAVYDKSLNYLNSILLQNIEYSSYFYNPIYAIPLKNEIAAFSYYIKDAEFFTL